MACSYQQSSVHATPASKSCEKATAKLAVKIGIGLLDGKKPEQVTTLIPSKLITRDNVKDYIGWTADR